jgi:hypothetical protein
MWQMGDECGKEKLSKCKVNDGLSEENKVWITDTQ